MSQLKKLKALLNDNGQWIVLGAIIFYVILFSFISLWKYYNFLYNGLDLAIINQVFYNSSLGNFFTATIHPPSYLGDHFTPILFLLLPLYSLFKNPQILLILQTIILGLSAWPIYLITKKVLTKPWAVGLSLAWLLNPFVANINLFEFHFLPFAIFFIFFGFYFYYSKKFIPFTIFCVLALLVREDVAFVIVAFGLLAILEKRKIQWWLAPIFLSILYFLMAMNVISYFSPISEYKFLFYYSWLGNSWPEIIKNVIFNPWILIPKIFNPGSLIVALGLLLPTAYLALLRPKYLLLSLLIFLQLIMSVSWLWLGLIFFTQYSSLLLPGIFLATIFGIKVLYQPQKKSILNLIIKERPLTIAILIIAVFYSTIFIGPVYGSLKMITAEGITLPQTKIKNEILDQIPAQAAVAATFDLITTLSSRQNITSLNYIFLGKQQFLDADYSLPANTEYLAIDFTDLITYQLLYGLNPSYKNQYDIALTNWPNIFENFGLIDISGSIALYKKGVNDKFNLIKILDQLPIITNEQNINVNKNIKFLGFNKPANHHQLFWQLDLPLDEVYHLQVSLTQDGRTVYEKLLPFGYGLLQAGDNLTKKNIQTNYWFEFADFVPSGSYELSLSLIKITAGGLELEPTRATKNVIDKKKVIGEKFFLETINY